MRTIICLLPLLAQVACSPPPAVDPLVGSWKASVYLHRDGSRHPLDGRIFFDGNDWMVLFFVLDGEGQPVRGSGEGGRYEVDGENLLFLHSYLLSGGEGVGVLEPSRLRMQVRSPEEAGREASTYRIVDDRLTISFPSGNTMEFQRER